ncbi:hypothetical protein [Actinoallomurus soli]|uniref:hypothetical protein n=1 Tax=Actinoallomurus soli TaxID=2952535 RepID=UPI00209377C5|nr:hypothetical protein [Actinoallomurus soli]MCO5966934.1 hypothetical protein [Actinoallomurus soli]
MTERMTRGLRVLVLLFGVLGIVLGPVAEAAVSQRAVPAVSASASVVAPPPADPASPASATVAETPGASATLHTAAATVSGAVVVVTRSNVRARTAAKISPTRRATSEASAILPGHATIGIDQPLIGTAGDPPALLRQATALTPRGRGPPSITGS